jgi:hypothetical protein
MQTTRELLPFDGRPLGYAPVESIAVDSKRYIDRCIEVLARNPDALALLPNDYIEPWGIIADRYRNTPDSLPKLDSSIAEEARSYVLKWVQVITGTWPNILAACLGDMYNYGTTPSVLDELRADLEAGERTFIAYRESLKSLALATKS